MAINRFDQSAKRRGHVSVAGRGGRLYLQLEEAIISVTG